MEFFTFRRIRSVFLKSGLVTLVFFGIWALNAHTRPNLYPATRNLFLFLIGYGLLVHPFLVSIFRALGKLFRNPQTAMFTGSVIKGTLKALVEMEKHLSRKELIKSWVLYLLCMTIPAVFLFFEHWIFASVLGVLITIFGWGFVSWGASGGNECWAVEFNRGEYWYRDGEWRWEP